MERRWMALCAAFGFLSGCYWTSWRSTLATSNSFKSSSKPTEPDPDQPDNSTPTLTQVLRPVELLTVGKSLPDSLHHGANSATLAKYNIHGNELTALFHSAYTIVTASPRTVFRASQRWKDRTPSTIIVSACTHVSYCDIHQQALEMYTARHDLDYLLVRDELDYRATRSGWSKILLIRLLLETFAIVVWLDADIIFRNLNSSLEHLITRPHQFGLDLLLRAVSDRVDPYNTALLVVKSDPVTKAWFERWYIAGWLYQSRLFENHFKEALPDGEAYGHRCRLYWEQGCAEFVHQDFPLYASKVLITAMNDIAQYQGGERPSRLDPIHGAPLFHACCRTPHAKLEALNDCLNQLETKGRCIPRRLPKQEP